MLYQTSLALFASAVSIVARPTSGYALNSALLKKEEKQVCFCFQLSKPDDQSVKCHNAVFADRNDEECNIHEVASSMRCCDRCTEYGCETKHGISVGYNASETGGSNSMIEGHGKLVDEEWKKATDAALGTSTKTKSKDKKGKENKKKDDDDDDSSDSDSDSDSDDGETLEGEDTDD